ncbi:MAG: N-terminal cleavage protein, partial [Phycisphaerales bacterium]|nr:N-terminal cleavage protein [Phycisphaerales bacterium]
LLVVIGIIGLLIAILLPALNQVRVRARDLKCASNLRQLVMASTMFLNEHRTYPDATQLAAFGGPVPLALDERLINIVGPYLKWPVVTPTNTVLTLPAVAVCEARRTVDGLMDYNYALGNPYWNTGYSYCGGLGKAEFPNATVLQPDRQADAKGRRRGVLWADNLMLLYAGPSPTGWAYFHLSGPHVVEPVFATIPDPKSYRGHHRAWSDGSVEFLRRGDFSLNSADADITAAYRITGPTGLRLYQYW